MARELLLDSVVGLVIAYHGPQVAVQTITSFAEAAHYPASLWIAVDRASLAHQLIKEAKRFSLAVFSEGQEQTARQFRESQTGSRWSMDQLALYQSPQGYLFARNVLTCTGCELTQSVDIDDHTLFFADIIESHYDSRRSGRRQLLASEL